jgi:hypothetical protein
VADEPVERASAINLIGASATVAALGAVVVWWAVSGRHPGGVVVGAGLLVLAAAGVGAGLGRPRERVRRGTLGGGGVALVVAVVAIGALVAQARSVDVGGDRTVELDEHIEAAWAQGDAIVAVTFDRVVTIDDEDGTTRNGSGLAIGDHVLTPSGAIVTRDTGGEIVLRDPQGAEVWRVAVSADDRPAERGEVIAADAEGRVAVRVCIEARCELVGIDAGGDESWRRPVDEAVVGEGTVVVDRPSDPDLHVAPSRLVVVEDPEAPGAEAVEIDLATGESTTLGAAGEVAVVDDVVTIARRTDDGCEVGIVRGDAPEETVTAPCFDSRLGTATPMGSVVVHEQLAGFVGIDVDSGEAATVAVDPAGGVRTTLTGDGIVVRAGLDGVELRSILDDTVLATFGDDWGLVASGPDGVVLERERESGNPFAPEELREVAVVDPASGEICARVRLDVPFLSRASPLPGCRAVLSPPDGPDVLIG